MDDSSGSWEALTPGSSGSESPEVAALTEPHLDPTGTDNLQYGTPVKFAPSDHQIKEIFNLLRLRGSSIENSPYRTFRVSYLDHYVDVTIATESTVDLLHKFAQRAMVALLRIQPIFEELLSMQVYIRELLYYEERAVDGEKVEEVHTLHRDCTVGHYFGNPYFGYITVIKLHANLSVFTPQTTPILNMDPEELNSNADDDDDAENDDAENHLLIEEVTQVPIEKGTIQDTLLLYKILQIFFYLVYPLKLQEGFGYESCVSIACQTFKMLAVVLIFGAYAFFVFFDPFNDDPAGGNIFSKHWYILSYYLIPGVYCCILYGLATMFLFSTKKINRIMDKFLEPVIQRSSRSWIDAVKRANVYILAGLLVGALPGATDLVVEFGYRNDCPHSKLMNLTYGYTNKTVIAMSVAKGILNWTSLPPLIIILFISDIHIAELDHFQEIIGRWKVQGSLDNTHVEINGTFQGIISRIKKSANFFKPVLTWYIVALSLWVIVASYLSFQVVYKVKGCWSLKIGLLITTGASIVWYFMFVLWRLSRVSSRFKDLCECVNDLSPEDQTRANCAFQRRDEINTFCHWVNHSRKTNPGFYILYKFPASRIAMIVLTGASPALGALAGYLEGHISS